MSEYENYYETNDLALAAALIEQGITYKELDKSDRRRVVFIFANSSKLQILIDDYWLDSLKVNPKSYFDTLKHLKTQIYSR